MDCTIDIIMVRVIIVGHHHEYYHPRSIANNVLSSSSLANIDTINLRREH
jgi:hypothetical protein